MADKILHKRSLTSGSIPTISSLDTGELAINVNDGKLYLRQSGSSVDKIVNVGESASFATSASFAQTSSYVQTAQTASYVLNAVSSSYALTASFVISTERRSDYTSSLDPNINLLYLGYADFGSPESSTVWTISQLSISSSGATTTRSTSSAAWTNRYSYTYL